MRINNYQISHPIHKDFSTNLSLDIEFDSNVLIDPIKDLDILSKFLDLTIQSAGSNKNLSNFIANNILDKYILTFQNSFHIDATLIHSSGCATVSVN